jgi:hypothetical protein
MIQVLIGTLELSKSLSEAKISYYINALSYQIHTFRSKQFFYSISGHFFLSLLNNTSRF